MSDVIRDLRDLHAKAAPWPWTLEVDPDLGALIVDVRGDDLVDVQDMDDADLIVRVVNALPFLLDAVEAAEEAYSWGNWAHSYKCEYRTAAKGWKQGEPPIIECVCGLDNLIAALARLREEEKP